MDTLRFLSIGQEARQLVFVEVARERGDSAVALPLLKGHSPEDIWDAYIDVDVVILPIPILDKEGFINLKADLKWNPRQLLARFKPGTIVSMGLVPDDIRSTCGDLNLHVVDLVRDEAFCRLNAIPTAEGAIFHAMQASSITLHNANCVVFGFGRVGKALGLRLDALGANVTIATRSEVELAAAFSVGIQSMALSDDKLNDCLSKADFIFNSIPAIVINEKLIAHIHPQAILMELASLPGGYDLAAVSTRKLNFMSCQGLPGAVAPRTAAEYMYNAIRPIALNHLHKI